MPTPTELPARLRGAVAKLRTTSMPLADMIPLMQQSADAIERLQAENQALRAEVRGYALQELSDSGQALAQAMKDHP